METCSEHVHFLSGLSVAESATFVSRYFCDYVSGSFLP